MSAEQRAPGPGRWHLSRHARFYGAVAGGLLAFALGVGLPGPTRLMIAGDVFFAVYLALIFWFARRMTPARLRLRARWADEGLPIIFGITGFVVVVVLVAVFLIVNARKEPPDAILALALASIPLGWTMVQVLASFHYADLFYTPGARAAEGDAAPAGDAGGLEFPKTPEPGMGDFTYYAFVIGMTAQVSDVQVTSGAFRRATLAHGVFSFFYNTVLIAFSVNAAVALTN
ncbi:MAG: DUF1345 domain-containing protein [Rhodovulum sulfidophilum]|uniref:DUF1345 domain-containing protein n=1 Tax=Rhodovulum sulfidophilum TaxID=35806 RepID=A0A2W5NAY1_RHOSU|nr:MAG: DUF1345 domain-containing protein [Rhodovulum sulfidophilum]